MRKHAVHGDNGALRVARFSFASLTHAFGMHNTAAGLVQ